MRELEASNREQIEALNQRGGRTLSIVDLLLAGTVSAEMAAYVGAAVGRGASFLTAASPGGAGKTALLAALLGFLPPGRSIVTVDQPGRIAAAEETADPACHLVHEIGRGHWYGYLWGPPVERYLGLAGTGHTVASCLHADTLEEIYDRLAAGGVANPEEAIRGVELLLFMQVDGSPGPCRRRVAQVWERHPSGNDHALVFRWQRETDRFVRLGGSNDSRVEERLLLLLSELSAKGVREYGAVRERILAACPGN